MNDIDWSRLTHAYGPADDTPGHLRRLASADAKEREQARGDLLNTLGHQGTRFTATKAAVPRLFELLDNPAVLDKDGIVRLLVSFAVGNVEEFLPHGIDPQSAFADAAQVAPEDAGPEHYDDYDPEVAAYWSRDAYRAVLAGVAQLGALARHADAATRRAAVFALAWFPDAAPESIVVVRQGCRQTAEPAEAANAILCLGILGRYLKDSADAAWLQSRLASGNPYPVRAAAAISLGVILGEALPRDALDFLLEVIQDVPRAETEGQSAAWHCNGLIGHVCAVLNTLALTPSEPIVAALCRATEAAPFWPFLNLLDTLLGLVFPDGEAVRFEPDATLASGQRVVYRDPASITGVQRQALQAIGGNAYWASKRGFGPHEELLWQFGIPGELEQIRALIGS